MVHTPYSITETIIFLDSYYMFFLITKDLTILNDCSATRKDRIIDLTITNSSFARRVNNWKVDEEIIFFKI